MGDAAFIATLGASENVLRFIGGLRVPDDEAAKTLFILEREGIPIGLCGFVTSQAFEGQDMELICAIIPAAEERKFGTEACKALVTWAIEARRWPRILACVDDENERGLALASRLGFQEVGRRPMNPDVRVLAWTRPAGS